MIAHIKKIFHSWFKIEDSSLRGNIADVLSEHRSAQEFSLEERSMLDNILRLQEICVEDVMVPRADIEAVEENLTLGSLMGLFEKSEHSRLPVYGSTLDEPLGMIHIRDVLAYIVRSARKKGSQDSIKEPVFNLKQVNLDVTIKELGVMRTILFVPPSMPVSDLMARMQMSRTQMALVIDEYGGTDGLVSFEDLVEMIVGNIEDEHDDAKPSIKELEDGVFLVNAKEDITDVIKIVGSDFSAGEHGEHVDTIGGVILNILGRVPKRGEVIRVIPGFELHVIDADLRSIKTIRIVRLLEKNEEQS